MDIGIGGSGGGGSDGGGWPHLPPDLLSLIIKKLLPDNISDIARFRSVCSLWCSAIPFAVADRNYSSSQLPWLMLPYPLSSSLTTRIFFSLSSSSSFSRLHLPELRRKTYHGTNRNWLFVLDTGITTPPSLFNPFTQSRISLPPLPLPTIWKDKYSPDYDFYYHLPPSTTTPKTPPHPQLPDDKSRFLQRGFSRPSLAFSVLSADPSSAISSSDLSRPGDAAWTPVVNCDTGQPCKLIRHLAYWNGRFYAVDDNDNLIVVVMSNTSSSSSAATSTVLLPLPQRIIERSSCYLVGSDQRLLLVIRSWVKGRQRKDYTFQIFNLVEEEEEEEKHKLGSKHRWEKVESIGEQSLFISEENSIAVSTSGRACCKPSCIYYCDIYDDKGLLSETSTKLIEFCIEDGTTKMIHCSSKSSTLLCQPFWIQPSLRL